MSEILPIALSLALDQTIMPLQLAEQGSLSPSAIMRSSSVSLPPGRLKLLAIPIASVFLFLLPIQLLLRGSLLPIRLLLGSLALLILPLRFGLSALLLQILLLLLLLLALLRLLPFLLTLV